MDINCLKMNALGKTPSAFSHSVYNCPCTFKTTYKESNLHPFTYSALVMPSTY